MTIKILQISNGFLLFEYIENLQNAVYFRNKEELCDTLKSTLPKIEDD